MMKLLSINSINLPHFSLVNSTYPKFELMEADVVNFPYKTKGKLPNKNGLTSNFKGFHNNSHASIVTMRLVIF